MEREKEEFTKIIKKNRDYFERHKKRMKKIRIIRRKFNLMVDNMKKLRKIVTGFDNNEDLEFMEISESENEQEKERKEFFIDQKHR